MDSSGWKVEMQKFLFEIKILKSIAIDKDAQVLHALEKDVRIN
jgi:hypothetical protein